MVAHSRKKNTARTKRQTHHPHFPLASTADEANRSSPVSSYFVPRPALDEALADERSITDSQNGIHFIADVNHLLPWLVLARDR